jgi:serine/threonine protein kinase
MSLQENILVDFDGTAQIAGLGSALILGHTTSQSEMSAGRLFRGIAPELMRPEEYGFPYPQNSKASDIYAFGVLALEARDLHRIFRIPH